MRTATRLSIILLVAAALVGCAGRQYTPSTPPEIRIAASLDALAHVVNAVAKETVILRQQNKLTDDESHAIATWCRAADRAIPHAFGVLKASTADERAAALSAALADVGQAKPLKDLIAKRGAEPEVQAAVALAQSALLLIREFTPEVPNGK